MNAKIILAILVLSLASMACGFTIDLPEREQPGSEVKQTIFEHTETEWGPWTIVEATDRHFTWVKIYKTIINSLAERLAIEFPPLSPAEPEMEQPVIIDPGIEHKVIDKALAEKELEDIDDLIQEENEIDD